MENSKDKYHLEMRFCRIIGRDWMVLCAIG